VCSYGEACSGCYCTLGAFNIENAPRCILVPPHIYIYIYIYESNQYIFHFLIFTLGVDNNVAFISLRLYVI
jgi:hypothetical protein